MNYRWLASALFLFLATFSAYASPGIVLLADETSPFVQNDRADNDDLSRIKDTAMLRRFVDSGYLVSVPASTRYYYVHNVSSQFRYTRPWTRMFVTRLSQQFYSKFGHRLRVTSLVRTEGSQRRLARRNRNAADAVGDSRSSHLTGATVDISKRLMSRTEQEWMRQVLYSLREQGYVYAIEEFAQPTFHIMVYRSYPKYIMLLTKDSRHPSRKRPTRKLRADSVPTKAEETASAD